MKYSRDVITVAHSGNFFIAAFVNADLQCRFEDMPDLPDVRQTL
ncbi:MAG: hypothetical protein ACRD2U_09635 [Terriglobales bacterium]